RDSGTDDVSSHVLPSDLPMGRSETNRHVLNTGVADSQAIQKMTEVCFRHAWHQKSEQLRTGGSRAKTITNLAGTKSFVPAFFFGLFSGSGSNT
ncbi:MAG: hypothetical protein AAB927_02965, partial [Patescibacteria group bacterium]